MVTSNCISRSPTPFRHRVCMSVIRSRSLSWTLLQASLCWALVAQTRKCLIFVRQGPIHPGRHARFLWGSTQRFRYCSPMAMPMLLLPRWLQRFSRPTVPKPIPSMCWIRVIKVSLLSTSPGRWRTSRVPYIRTSLSDHITTRPVRCRLSFRLSQPWVLMLWPLKLTRWMESTMRLPRKLPSTWRPTPSYPFIVLWLRNTQVLNVAGARVDLSEWRGWENCMVTISSASHITSMTNRILWILVMSTQIVWRVSPSLILTVM